MPAAVAPLSSGAAIAEPDLRVGGAPDGAGGDTAWGRLLPASRSGRLRVLPAREGKRLGAPALRAGRCAHL